MAHTNRHIRKTATTFGLGLVALGCSHVNVSQEAREAPTAKASPAAGPATQQEGSKAKLAYPLAKRSDQVDNYHGTKVADPYRWLESLDAKDTREWVEAENRVTFGYLATIPSRQRLHERLTQLWNFERYTPPFLESGRYFYTRNDGLQNQNVLYTTPSLSAEAKVLLDPNALSKDGTVALTGLSVSRDGKLLAYGLAGAGSDWQEWRVRDIQSGQDRADLLKWIKFSNAAWTPDNQGFYYARYKEPAPGAQLEEVNYHQKLYYHHLGDPQAKDQLIYERPDQKEWHFAPKVTDDGRYLIVTVPKSSDARYRIYYKDLKKKGAGLVELIGNFDNEYSFIDNDGPVFWFKSDKGAPRGRVIAIDTRQPDEKSWKVLIPEATEKLDYVAVINDQFVTTYLKDAHTQVRVFSLAGKPVREVEMPGIGTAVGFAGKRKDRETFYSFTTFTSPATIYRFDLTSFQSAVYRQPKVAFDPAQYETRQVFFTSKDGTRVPLFVSHKRGLNIDGQNPTLLYGYGGFNISLTPSFKVRNLVFMEMGGVYAEANLRGGGEYGQEWHRAGTKLNKQRVFDDFIGAAEWLIQNKYTSSPRLAIAGGSNGGLLVGACITQRPDLFGAALPAVGVMDMLRFHKFTVGYNWVDDFGSAENPDEFKALYAYSPLHNIKEGTQYPAVLITTADHDDRVVPGHSFKFAAAIQAAHKGDRPVLIRIETQAGHGGGKPTGKLIDEAADQLAFLQRELKIP